MTIGELLDVLWRDYVAATPQAERIRQLLTQRGEILCDDHVALRSFGVPGIGIDALARPFEALGWRERGRYRCHDRHVRARHWEHDDAALPKVLISELVLDELSPDAEALIGALVRQPGLSPAALPWQACRWRVTHAGYLALLAESEYAAWVAAFGPGVNHFTVDVDSLSTFPDLEALAAFLVDHGFRLEGGGAITGSRAARLERLSTRADAVAVAFADATVRIPSCRYQFARRYRLPSGEMFHGFVPPSADRVGESIDVGLSV